MTSRRKGMLALLVVLLALPIVLGGGMGTVEVALWIALLVAWVGLFAGWAGRERV